jgi:hypothetical protein
MRLSDLFDHLTFGELAHVFIGGGDKREIAPTSYRELGLHLNMGLTALHTRFLLREGVIQVVKQHNQYDYFLRSQYAVSSTTSTEEVRYLQDTPASPFLDNVIRVTGAYTGAGEALVINVLDSPNSIYTPGHDRVQIPMGTAGDVFAITFQADHPRLEIGTATDPSQEEVSLHPSFLQALLYYVASRAVITAGSDATGDTSQKYLAMYEMECQRLATYNLGNESFTTNNVLENNGWA